MPTIGRAEEIEKFISSVNKNNASVQLLIADQNEVGFLEPKKLYDYEPTFDKPGKTFSYKEIYPEIFDPKFVEKLKTGKNPDVSDDYDEIEM